MANILPYTPSSDVRRELTATFGCHLSIIRRRLLELRRVRGYAAAVERRYLRKQEAAWQLGTFLLERSTSDDLADLAAFLDANAKHGGPAGIAFATMGAMIAIRSLWSAAVSPT